MEIPRPAQSAACPVGELWDHAPQSFQLAVHRCLLVKQLAYSVLAQARWCQ
jgi:hypothetical protein